MKLFPLLTLIPSFSGLLWSGSALADSQKRVATDRPPLASSTVAPHSLGFASKPVWKTGSVSCANATLGQACASGLGICAAKGKLVCDAFDHVQCDAVPGLPQTEICGDSQDSDCDGDPNDGCVDSDGDGLFDAVELANGTNPFDADSDDDGVVDGAEVAYAADSDGDGAINALDADSDDDGLFDGTELGLDCSSPATDLLRHHCIADADAGATKTDPILLDSDHGGLLDGLEDTNHDGHVDAGERDPNQGSDDLLACFADAECGDATSGRVCDATNACVDGCHSGGNGCPNDRTCTSMTADLGVCQDLPTTSSSAGGAGGGDASSTTGPGASTSSRGSGGRTGSTGTGWVASQPASDDPLLVEPGSGGASASYPLPATGCAIGARSGVDGRALTTALALVAGLVIARRRRR